MSYCSATRQNQDRRAVKDLYSAYLDNLFITHTSQEDALAAFVFLGEPFNDMCHFSIAERLNALARLRVPELDLPIMASREETSASG